MTPTPPHFTGVLLHPSGSEVAGAASVLSGQRTHSLCQSVLRAAEQRSRQRRSPGHSHEHGPTDEHGSLRLHSGMDAQNNSRFLSMQNHCKQTPIQQFAKPRKTLNFPKFSPPGFLDKNLGNGLVKNFKIF